MVSVPHGPETGDDHLSMRGIPEKGDEERVLKQLLYPDDTHTADGTYWADLSFGQQLKFNASVDNAEALKELKEIGAMTKRDPLSPIGWYFRNAVLPGAGLGLEGWVFSLFLIAKDADLITDMFFSPLVILHRCSLQLGHRVGRHSKYVMKPGRKLCSTLRLWVSSSGKF